MFWLWFYTSLWSNGKICINEKSHVKLYRITIDHESEVISPHSYTEIAINININVPINISHLSF